MRPDDTRLTTASSAVEVVERNEVGGAPVPAGTSPTRKPDEPAWKDRLARRLGLMVIDPAPIRRAQIREGVKAAIAPFITSRALVGGATLFGARYLPASPGNYSALYPPASIAPFFRWDADAYGFLAQHGYQGGVQTVRAAFFPLYPLLIHLSGGSVWAMLVIPNACFFVALSLIYLVAVKRMDVERARLTLWLVALGPAAMFFAYPYTESLFLMVTVAVFVLMESGHWLMAGVAGFAAGLTRAPGVVVGAALGAEGILGPRRKLALAAVSLPVAGLVAVSLIDWISVGDPLGFAHAQASWVAPNRNLIHLFGLFAKAVLERDPFRPEAIAMPVFLVFAVGTVWTLRRLPVSYGAYAFAQLLLAGNQAVYLHSFYSLPRYLAVIFPCYLAFATWLAPRRGWRLAWLAVSVSILVVNAALYGAWRFIG